MGRLMRVFAERLFRNSKVANAVLDWTGDPGGHADNVPLRLAGALHALRLSNRALVDVYPPQTASDDVLWSAILQTFDEQESFILGSLTLPPQTNEVRRSATILPALHSVRALWPHPVELIELGCSGGLNLRADRFRLDLPQRTLGSSNSRLALKPDWSGPPPDPGELNIASRRGVDLSPIDPTEPAGALRLMSYVWPDQPERLQQIGTAIEIAKAFPAAIDIADAGSWLHEVLLAPRQGRTRFVFHTVAAQYFSEETRRKVDTVLTEAGARATDATPLAHFAMEADGGRGAGLQLTLWPGGESFALGRADFHGRWVEWSALPYP